MTPTTSEASRSQCLLDELPIFSRCLWMGCDIGTKLDVVVFHLVSVRETNTEALGEVLLGEAKSLTYLTKFRSYV